MVHLQAVASHLPDTPMMVYGTGRWVHFNIKLHFWSQFLFLWYFQSDIRYISGTTSNISAHGSEKLEDQQNRKYRQRYHKNWKIGEIGNIRMPDESSWLDNSHRRLMNDIQEICKMKWDILQICCTSHSLSICQATIKPSCFMNVWNLVSGDVSWCYKHSILVLKSQIQFLSKPSYSPDRIWLVHHVASKDAKVAVASIHLGHLQRST